MIGDVFIYFHVYHDLLKCILIFDWDNYDYFVDRGIPQIIFYKLALTSRQIRRKTYLKILNLQVFVEIEHDYHKITVLSIMNAYGLQWYVISENIQTNW